MSTSSQSAALNAHAPTDLRQDPATFGHGLLSTLAAMFARVRASLEDRRVRQHLATLPDSLLRDIGIAEDEIHRIRACERFTPRAWAERMGTVRRPWDL